MLSRSIVSHSYSVKYDKDYKPKGYDSKKPTVINLMTIIKRNQDTKKVLRLTPYRT
jgi:hypothetical protein